MGVAGCGKSAVGAALAGRIGANYLDGDDLHPPENIEKMSRGEPLTDEDRWPWLTLVGRTLAQPRGTLIIGCSALKRSYRDVLRAAAPTTLFVHLAGDQDVVRRRVAGRPGHFMPASLVATQFATLEPLDPDESGIEIDLDQPVDRIVEAYLHAAVEAL